jgi:hypothetical protein
LELLDMVKEVAELADGAARTISTRAWDRARPRSERFADAPAARRIAEHLGLPWSKVRELAFMGPRGRLTGLSHALGQDDSGWLTEEYADFVLRLVARRLGVATLRPVHYSAERERMLREDRARWLQGGQLHLPNEDQVIAVAGSWDRALANAGLSPRSEASKPRSGRPSIIEVLDRCYEHHGAQPTINENVTFARANGIPYPRPEPGKPWSSYVREWKQGRQAKGLAVPERPPPKARRPDYSVDVGAALPGEWRGRKRWDDLDEVVEWVVAYLAQLQPGERSSQRGYDQWVSTQEGAPMEFRGRPPRRLDARSRRGLGAAAQEPQVAPRGRLPWQTMQPGGCTVGAGQLYKRARDGDSHFALRAGAGLFGSCPILDRDRQSGTCLHDSVILWLDRVRQVRHRLQGVSAERRRSSCRRVADRRFRPVAGQSRRGWCAGSGHARFC